MKEKYQLKEHNGVLGTPRLERRNVRAEIPKIVHEDEVESICTRVLTSAFWLWDAGKSFQAHATHDEKAPTGIVHSMERFCPDITGCVDGCG